MRRAMKTSVLLAMAPLLMGLAACGSSGESVAEGAAPAATAPCDNLPAAAPAASLPDGYPALAGQTLYEPSTQGQTKIVFGRIDQTDFLAVRDELVTKMQAAGYEIEGKDQESVEAEAEFKGPHDGTIKVQPLCQGKIAIRYKFNS